MKRLDALQGMRTIAFLAVFFGHCGIGTGGGMGVSFFLVLSGFLMAYNYSSKKLPCDARENFVFAANKIKKLYPLHLLTIIPMGGLSLLSALKTGKLYEIALNLIPKLISDVLLIQAWIPVREFYFAFNGVAWFLSVCAFLYFCYPYFAKKMENWRDLKPALCWLGGACSVQLSIIVLIETGIVGILSKNVGWLVYICPIYRIGEFIVGCSLGNIFWKYIYIKRECINKGIASILEMLAILLMVGCYILPEVIQIPEAATFSLRYLPGSAAIVMVFAAGRGVISELLSKRPILEMGNLSGYAFLIHQVVINLIESMGIHGVRMILASIIITLLTSYLYKKICDLGCFRL